MKWSSNEDENKWRFDCIKRRSVYLCPIACYTNEQKDWSWKYVEVRAFTISSVTVTSWWYRDKNCEIKAVCLSCRENISAGKRTANTPSIYPTMFLFHKLPKTSETFCKISDYVIRKVLWGSWRVAFISNDDYLPGYIKSLGSCRGQHMDLSGYRF